MAAAGASSGLVGSSLSWCSLAKSRNSRSSPPRGNEASASELWEAGGENLPQEGEGTAREGFPGMEVAPGVSAQGALSQGKAELPLQTPEASAVLFSPLDTLPGVWGVSEGFPVGAGLVPVREGPSTAYPRVKPFAGQMQTKIRVEVVTLKTTSNAKPLVPCSPHGPAFPAGSLLRTARAS